MRVKIFYLCSLIIESFTLQVRARYESMMSQICSSIQKLQDQIDKHNAMNTQLGETKLFIAHMAHQLETTSLLSAPKSIEDITGKCHVLEKLVATKEEGNSKARDLIKSLEIVLETVPSDSHPAIRAEVYRPCFVA